MAMVLKIVQGWEAPTPPIHPNKVSRFQQSVWCELKPVGNGRGHRGSKSRSLELLLSQMADIVELSL
jgi:hypothetical protein